MKIIAETLWLDYHLGVCITFQ